MKLVPAKNARLAAAVAAAIVAVVAAAAVVVVIAVAAEIVAAAVAVDTAVNPPVHSVPTLAASAKGNYCLKQICLDSKFVLDPGYF